MWSFVSSSVRPRALALVGVLGAAAAGCGGLLLATSDHLVYPLPYALFVSITSAGTIAVGLYWSIRRPKTRTGPLLIALGFVYAGLSLQGASNPVAHSIGVIFDVGAFVYSAYVLFAFPAGRLRSLERGLLAAATIAMVVGFVPTFFFSQYVGGGAPLARCSACPENGLLVADRPEVVAEFARPASWLLVFAAVTIVVGLLYRIATAKAPERRTRAPVLLWTSAYAASLGTAVALSESGAGPGVSWDAGWALTVTFGTLSYSFLVAAVLGTVFAAGALKRMLRRLGNHPSSTSLRAVVAEAFDDSELEVGFWLPKSGRYVDVTGREVALPTPGSERAVTEFVDGRQRVALVHHSALKEDPGLLQAAGTVIGLTLESERLEAELQRSNDELRASRRRVVSAADAERRRIERDLHDSAQQQLIALRMRLGLAGELARDGGRGLPELLADAGNDLDAALAELRGLAHGIYPPLLVEGGLADALGQAARRSRLQVRFDPGDNGRYPENVEAAVYFACVEALQNAAKHAGDGAHVDLRVWEQQSSLYFEVRDDGVGFDGRGDARGGVGLLNMADRIGAIGGSVEVSSEPGLGTVVAGHVPLIG